MKLDPDSIQFGDCPIGERRDVVLTMRNAHDLLPLTFVIPHLPNYRAEPNKGTLMPLETGQVIVTFMPKHMGNFEAILKIMYCDQLYTYPLYLFGECHKNGVPEVRPKGLEKIAADFEPNYNYVN